LRSKRLRFTSRLAGPFRLDGEFLGEPIYIHGILKRPLGELMSCEVIALVVGCGCSFMGVDSKVV
jgi:hypothetical protein